ncbi:hypothetical protein H4W80_009229 [Nonomuraea angiospora]|uniref:Uncharacterized protein n=1 Tax=Nonomuraea angiospora TaxID=46172 RepID=A0ABR9MDH4_9ACTN|nr:hypothetical protein [Nonomuraea angiospora]
MDLGDPGSGPRRGLIADRRGKSRTLAHTAQGVAGGRGLSWGRAGHATAFRVGRGVGGCRCGSMGAARAGLPDGEGEHGASAPRAVPMPVRPARPVAESIRAGNRGVGACLLRPGNGRGGGVCPRAKQCGPRASEATRERGGGKGRGGSPSPKGGDRGGEPLPGLGQERRGRDDAGGFMCHGLWHEVLTLHSWGRLRGWVRGAGGGLPLRAPGVVTRSEQLMTGIDAGWLSAGGGMAAHRGV